VNWQKVSKYGYTEAGEDYNNDGGWTPALEYCKKISDFKTSTNFFRVSTKVDKRSKQGFYYVYQYIDDDRKRRSISRSNLQELKSIILEKNLQWVEF
jgi:hypothetical protein